MGRGQCYPRMARRPAAVVIPVWPGPGIYSTHSGLNRIIYKGLFNGPSEIELAQSQFLQSGGVLQRALMSKYKSGELAPR